MLLWARARAEGVAGEARRVKFSILMGLGA